MRSIAIISMLFLSNYCTASQEETIQVNQKYNTLSQQISDDYKSKLIDHYQKGTKKPSLLEAKEKIGEIRQLREKEIQKVRNQAIVRNIESVRSQQKKSSASTTTNQSNSLTSVPTDTRKPSPSLDGSRMKRTLDLKTK